MGSDEQGNHHLASPRPKQRSRRGTELIAPCFAFLLAMLFSVRYAPPFASPGRDSGVFLYGGDRLLKGERPYVDFWDHKPPMIYVLNAIGLSLGKGLWGVWALENVIFSAAVALFFAAAARRLGLPAALMGTSFLIVASRNSTFFGTGNHTEGYAASLNALILGCALWRPSRRIVWVLAGMAASSVFFLKQSCVALPLAVGGVLAWLGMVSRRAEHKRHFVAYCVGAAVMTSLMVLWMAVRGVLSEFWDSNFVYGRIYVASSTGNTSMPGRWYRTIWQLDSLGILGMACFTMVCCCTAVLAVRLHAIDCLLQLPALSVAIAIPVEAWLSALSYRFYGHYYLTFFPLLALGWSLWAHLARMASRAIVAQENHEKMKKAVGVVLLLVPLCTMSGPLGVSQLRSMAKAVAFPESSAEEDEVLEYLRAQQADSPLLLWGAEARINFLSGRRSPTRYSYMYPLTFRRYQQRTRFAELLLDLAARPDTVIIDTLGDSPNCVGTARSVVPAKGVDRGFAWRPIPEELMLPLRKHIARHYERDRTFSNGWIAYLPRG